MADRVGAGRGLEAREAVSGSVRDTGASVGVGEGVKGTVGAGVRGKDADERVNGGEGDDHRIGVRVSSKIIRRMDIREIVVSLFNDIAFGKFLPSVLDTVGESIQSSLNLTLTKSQPILNPQKGFFVVLYNCSFII